MDNKGTEGSASGRDLASADNERIVCIIARDVLPLDKRDSASIPFVKTAWRGRRLILAFVVGFGILSIAYAFLATEWYEAEVLLAPTGTKNTRGLGNVLGSLGGLGGGLGSLAEFAGISIGATNTSEPIGVLKSREFARAFIEELGLLHVLLADKWDAHAGRWKPAYLTKEPDIRDGVKYFDKHVLKVQEDKKTGLVSVIIRWKNADMAAAWANTIVDRLNEQMRSRELVEAQANVDYLRDQLAQTNVVAVQQAVSKLLETEMQKVMVARGNKQFAFRVVDPAAVPKWRSEPKRTLIVALAMLVGGLAGLIAVFVRESYRSRGSNDVT